jgi:hypothetical protein
MSRRFHSLTAIVLCALICGCASETPASGDLDGDLKLPQISLSHDFGVVVPGSSLAHSFTINNTSPITWKVKSVRESCTCSVGDFEHDEIPPNSSSQIVFRYHAPKKPCDDHQSIVVRFDNSAAPILRMNVVARVRSPMVLFPPEAAFGQIVTGLSRDCEIRIENYSDIHWSDVQAATSTQQVRCGEVKLLTQTDNPEIGQPRQIWVIGIELNSLSTRLGTIDGSLTFTTKPGGLTASLPINATVVGKVSVLPKLVNFGTLAQGQPSGKVLLYIQTHGSLKTDLSPPNLTLSANTDTDKISWTRVPSRSDSPSLIQVEIVTNRTKAGPLRGVINISTKDGLIKESVEYIAVVEPLNNSAGAKASSR